LWNTEPSLALRLSLERQWLECTLCARNGDSKKCRLTYRQCISDRTRDRSMARKVRGDLSLRFGGAKPPYTSAAPKQGGAVMPKSYSICVIEHTDGRQGNS